MENAPNSATIPGTIQTNESNQENAPNIAPDVQAAQAVQATQAVPEATGIEAQPKRRGRPAGAKDKAPRKSRVVEVDIPDPTFVAPAPAAVPAPAPALAPAPAPVPEPEPEPLTPRRLYRETAAHLVHLRQTIQSDKRKAMADAYAKRLITLPQLYCKA
jgi:hypothetical protein